MKDIHDIKGLMEIPVPWLSFLLVALFGLSLLVVAGWWIWQRRKKRLAEPVVAKPLNKEDAYQQALKAIQNLKFQENNPGQFYQDLESIFKTLLQATSEKTISSYTNSQLQAFLNEHQLNSSKIQTFLQHSLQAKFAAESLSSQIMQQDRDVLSQWISEHKTHLLSL